MSDCVFCQKDANDVCVYCGNAVCPEHSFQIYDAVGFVGYGCLDCIPGSEMGDEEHGESV